jgi:hypothetical protein
MLISLVLVGRVVSLVVVVDGIEKLGESWMIIRSYLGAIAALCGLGFVILVKEGSILRDGFVCWGGLLWVLLLGWDYWLWGSVGGTVWTCRRERERLGIWTTENMERNWG